MAGILIIDDEAFIRDVLASRARRLGHTPFEAGNLATAAQILETREVDLVFLDVNLPDGSGLDALSDIKSGPTAPEVIIITAVGTADGAELAIKNGAWDYIAKPFRKEEIILLIQRSLAFRQARMAMDRSRILDTHDIVGKSLSIKHCISQVAQSAGNTANVLIQGETGTGKELFARAIHENCPHTPGRYVVVDCAAMPEALTESVLFGHAKGAFTGADKSSEGLVKGADNGTLFLDEVGELPLSVQKAFLRVLQERKFRPVGSAQEETSNFRLISATNRDLDAMVAKGTFRADLLHRLKTLTMTLPPLRERKEDIKDLAEYYMERLCRKHRISPKALLPDTLTVLSSYDWPGNVRELINALEKAMLSEPEFPLLYPMFLPDRIRVSHVSRDLSRKSTQSKTQGINPGIPLESVYDLGRTLDEMPCLKDYRETGVARIEKVYLRYLLSQTENQLDEAARIAGISKNRLYFLLRKYDLKPG